MMLGMFVDAVENNPIALEEFDGDLEPLVRKVHLLKGTAGNLSLTPLFQGYSRTLELLRAGQAGQARAELEAMLPVQGQITGCIRRNSR